MHSLYLHTYDRYVVAAASLLGQTNQLIELTIKIKGNSDIAKIFSAIHLGDWVSYHLAKEYGNEPLKTKMIDAVKER